MASKSSTIKSKNPERTKELRRKDVAEHNQKELLKKKTDGP
jgi:hypothetical protein